MPLDYFRRASFVCLCVYSAILSLAYHFGYLGVDFKKASKSALSFDSGFLVLARTPSQEGWGGWIFEGQILRSPMRGLVLARFPRNFPLVDVRPGDIVWVSGKLIIPEPARNPGDFDVRSFFSIHGISYRIDAYSLKFVARSLSPRWRIFSWAAVFRKSIQGAFGSRFDPVKARLLSGMVLGLKGRLPKTLNRQIQNAGVMHLLVPSGTKVALILAGIWFLGYRMSLRPLPRWGLAALAGSFYAIAVGGEPPYVRALLAALFFEWGLRSGRDAVPFQALVLSAWSELLWDPMSLFSMGFQMSYAAAFGLILGFPHLEGYSSLIKGNFPRRIIQIFGATVIVEAVLWPIFALGFGCAPFLGALANLILFPLAGAFMFGGLALWLSVLAHLEWISQILTWGLNGGLSFFCAVCRFFSGLPWSFVFLSHWSPFSLAAYYLAMFSLFLCPRWKLSAYFAAAALSVLLFGLARDLMSRSPTEITYLSLPRGQAALIQEKNRGASLVFFNANAGLVLKILRSEGVRKIRNLFLLPGSSSLEAERLASHLKILAVQRENADFQIQRGGYRFYFSSPEIQDGTRKFDIITSLRRHAVRAEINDRGIKIDASF